MKLHILVLCLEITYQADCAAQSLDYACKLECIQKSNQKNACAQMHVSVHEYVCVYASVYMNVCVCVCARVGDEAEVNEKHCR